MCDQGNFMGSGLDDYPRYEEGTISKQHLDLHCWMLLFAKSLKKIADFFNLKEYKIFFESEVLLFSEKLIDFIDKDNIYKDLSIF